MCTTPLNDSCTTSVAFHVRVQAEYEYNMRLSSNGDGSGVGGVRVIAAPRAAAGAAVAGGSAGSIGLNATYSFSTISSSIPQSRAYAPIGAGGSASGSSAHVDFRTGNPVVLREASRQPPVRMLVESDLRLFWRNARNFGR